MRQDYTCGHCGHACDGTLHQPFGEPAPLSCCPDCFYALAIASSPDSKLTTLLRGERCIVSHEWLDSIADHPAAGLIKTAYNKRQLGTKDTFVAWLHWNAVPADLTFDQKTMNAYASA